jgi:uncharacterized HAD superfamily protein
LGNLYYNIDGCLPKDNTMLPACYLETNHLTDYTEYIRLVNISFAYFDMYNKNFETEKKKQKLKNQDIREDSKERKNKQKS